MCQMSEQKAENWQVEEFHEKNEKKTKLKFFKTGISWEKQQWVNYWRKNISFKTVVTVVFYSPRKKRKFPNKKFRGQLYDLSGIEGVTKQREKNSLAP